MNGRGEKAGKGNDCCDKLLYHCIDKRRSTASNNTNSCVVIAGQLTLAFQQIREEPYKRSILQTPIRTQSDSHHYSTQLLSYNIALKQPALRGLL